MKWYIRTVVKPRTLAQLQEGILTFWKTKLTIALCNKYINHLYKVVPIVIEKKGKASFH
jgi:hypothetical protein